MCKKSSFETARRVCLIAIIAIAGSVCLATSVQANWLTNGDFEADPFDSDWENYEGNAVVHRGLTATGLDDEGTQAARLPSGNLSVYLEQAVSATSTWQLDMLFAAAQPDSGDRTLMTNIPTGEGTESIYMYVGNDGKLYAHGNDGTSLDWHKLSDTTVSFSVDADDNGSFADAGDTLNVYSLRIVGDYSVESPYWDIYLSTANSAALSLLAGDLELFLHDDKPEQGDTPERIKMACGALYSDYVIDNVIFAASGGTTTIPGDANKNGVVNDEDASILAAHWQQTGMAWGDGDFNNDGVVNDEDASILAAHWQEGAEGGAPVPEPTTATLLLAALATVGLLARRKRR